VHTIEARQHEFGIRLAVGANRLSLIRLILTQSLSLVVTGLLIGTIAAIGVAKSISSMLFAVDAGDPISFGVAVTVILAAAILAITLPSWRSSRLDPTVALRSQ
jgi:ABC-type antimicrobial peptide transport system permease subunit